jgi:serine/threonine protein kinase
MFARLKDYVIEAAGSVQEEALEVMSSGLDALSMTKKYKFKSNAGMHEVADIGVIHETKTGSISVARCVESKEIFALKRHICGGKNGFVTLQELEDADAEARLIMQLPPHPNIIQCFGTSLENNINGHVKLMLFEYCDGGTLADYLSDKAAGDVADHECVEVMLHMSRALHHLHSQELPTEHLAVTPEHIAWSNVQNQWKLLDFGSCVIKRVANDNMDEEAVESPDDEIREVLRQAVPSIADRPPEAQDGSELPLSPLAVDVWMLGLVLYQCMFVKKPFRCDKEDACKQIVDVPGWAAMTPAGGKLCILLHWLLASNPRSRPEARKLSSMLDKWDQLKPLSVVGQAPLDVRDAVKETLRAVERRIMLNYAMKKEGSDPQGNIRDSFLQALQILQAVPLSQLRQVVPQKLSEKIAKLRWSYGQPGFQGTGTSARESTDVGATLSEIDNVMENIGLDIDKELSEIDDALAELEDEVTDEQKQQVQTATVDLLDGSGEEWSKDWHADMKKADEQSKAEWQAMFSSEEDRNEKLNTLKEFFGPVAEKGKTAVESFDPLAA